MSASVGWIAEKKRTFRKSLKLGEQRRNIGLYPFNSSIATNAIASRVTIALTTSKHGSPSQRAADVDHPSPHEPNGLTQIARPLIKTSDSASPAATTTRQPNLLSNNRRRPAKDHLEQRNDADTQPSNQSIMAVVSVIQRPSGSWTVGI